MSTTWKVELHSHTHYSMDCLVRLEQIIRVCQQRGIDKIAITDHNTAEGAFKLAKMAPDLIIPGEEIMTTEGELLAYFVKESLPAWLEPQDAIRELRAQGAIISVSHPFDRLRKGAWDEPELFKILDQVDAIETFNARCVFPEDNTKSQKYAQQRGKLGTVGSDAHIIYEYGRATLQMQPFTDAASFHESLKTATAQTELSPSWVHGFSKYAKYMHKWGISKMPIEVVDSE